MKQKKLLALGMAALMAMSSSVMALAADVTEPESATGTIDGTGSLSGFVDKEVFVVTLPTTANVNFTLDPQELYKATNTNLKIYATAATTDTTDTKDTAYASTILFDKAANTYTRKSADITVVNKSTYDVDVKVKAVLSGLKKDGEDGYDIKVLDPTADDFDFGTDTAITMSITPTATTMTGTTLAAGTAGDATQLTADETGVEVTTKVAKIADVSTAYEIKDVSGEIKYQLKSDVTSIAFNAVSFNLAGTVNDDADWTNFNKDNNKSLKVQLTYSVGKHVDGLADGATVTGTNGATSLQFTVALPDTATAVKAVTLKNGSRTFATSGTITGGAVTLTDANTKAFLVTPGTYSLVITFEGSATTYTLSLVVPAA